MIIRRFGVQVVRYTTLPCTADGGRPLEGVLGSHDGLLEVHLF